MLHNVFHLYKTPNFIKFRNVLYFKLHYALLQVVTALQNYPIFVHVAVARRLFHYQRILRKTLERTYATEKRVAIEGIEFVVHYAYLMAEVDIVGFYNFLNILTNTLKPVQNIPQGIFEKTVFYCILAEKHLLHTI